MLVCMNGTQGFRENAGTLLPIEPKEDEAARRRRVSHAVLSPFTMRIADQAAGLIMRKPVSWSRKKKVVRLMNTDRVIQNVDGYGTDLDAFARRVVLNSLLLVIPPSWLISARNLRKTCSRNVSWVCALISWRFAQIRSWVGARKKTCRQRRSIKSELVNTSLNRLGCSAIVRCIRSGCWNAAPGQFGVRVKTAGPSRGDDQPAVIPLAVTYSNRRMN